MELEQLKKEEMDAHIAAGTFRLGLIGMSNAGKSYRSKKLRDEKKFLWYQVDEEIGKELGLPTIEDVAVWLGYPDGPHYAEHERKYLELEDKYTRNVSMRTNGSNFVFDTTGSVVHLREDALNLLRDNCLVVHLDIGEERLKEAVEKFFHKPKPVAWDGFFSQKEGESAGDALRRCYPKLLHERLARYRALAHVNIPATEVFNTSSNETLAAIRKRLK